MNYGFIGLGNMAGAILRGMHTSGRFGADTLLGFDVDAGKAQALAQDMGLKPLASEQAVAEACDLLLLAVKPQTGEGVLNKIRDHLRPNVPVVTILAGKPLAFYEERLKADTPVVRALPNINALAGQSATALCPNGQVTPGQLTQATALFEAVGAVRIIPESLARAFSALAGAGPAFAYLFIDALASAGVKAGFTREAAQQVAADMVLGSAVMVRDSGQHPVGLIDRVCSPGGTTIEGLHMLKALGFEHAVLQAVEAVMDKDRKLGET